MQFARLLLALTILALVVAAPVAGGKSASAADTARAELREYRTNHGWVGSVSFLGCKRNHGRLVCGAKVKGRRAGKPVVCAANVVVSSAGGRRSAKFRLGRCKAKGRSPSSAAAPSPVELHVHLGPTYTRDPLDPFKVTYSYSASATQAPSGKPAPLPPGTLAFYNDGKLECAVNVGPAVAGGTCLVRYAHLGEHKVTTIYSSGTESVTMTKVENIQPLPTSTSLSLSYANLPGGPEALDVGQRCTYVGNKCGWSCNFLPTPGVGSERCFYQQEWVLGTLTLKASSTPAGKVSLQCNPGTCITGDSGPALDGEMRAKVRMYVRGEGIRYPIGNKTPPTCEFMKENADHWAPDLTQTGYTATHIAPGYAGAPASQSITFSPTPPC